MIWLGGGRVKIVVGGNGGGGGSGGEVAGGGGEGEDGREIPGERERAESAAVWT